MREILFRGKRKDTGEWVFGDLVHSQYKLGDTCVGQYGNTVGIHQVSPETVGQFIGLTDKNDKKIFEGDFLKYQINIRTTIVGKIVFLCGAFVFESEELDRECDIAFSTFADDEIALSQHCIEVIGNIHDNTELLENA